MSAVDVSTLSVQVKSDGIKETADGLNKIFKEADKAERRVKTLTETVNKMSEAFTKGSASAQAYQQAVANANRTVGGSDKATSALTAAMAKLTSSVDHLVSGLGKVEVKSRQSAQAINFHKNAMNDAHAAARGLSGSLGALWVTYGNMAPLAAGLAIGAAFKSVVTTGKDVEHTLESIRVKGGESIASIDAMRDSLLEIGKGVYGPREVANAFETLILAGLNAKDALSSIKDALNLATVGGTTIEKSAYALVQVGTSLGYSAQNYSRIADVIAMTAATSMSSVESISEAFKSGSAVGKLYGATLEDIGTAFAALSNLGIQGSAAGTSLKNFYKELSSEAKKVQSTFADLKINPKDLKDAKGNFKSLAEILPILSEGMDHLTEAEQKTALNRLANERGLKTIVELLSKYREEGKLTETAFKDMNDKITNSFGYTAISAAALSLTVQSQFKSVANTLQTVFTQAFQNISPEMNAIATSLKVAFNSPEFLAGIQTISIALAQMALVIVENISLIAKLVAGLLAAKAVMFAVSLFQSISVALAAIGAGATAAMLPLGPLVAALIAAGAAYAFFSRERDASNMSTTQKTAIKYSEDYATALDQEAIRLRTQLDLLKQGKTAREAETESMLKQQVAMAKMKGDGAIREAETRLENAGMGVTLKDIEISDSIVKRGGMMTARVREFKAAQQNLLEVTQKVDAAFKRTIESQREVIKVSKELEDERKRQEANKPERVTGGGTLAPLGSEGKSTGKAIESEILALEKLAAGYAAKARQVNATADTELKAIGDVYRAQVAATIDNKNLEGTKYADRLRAAALSADTAKFELDRSKAIEEMESKLVRKMNVENAALKEANAGHTKLVGTLEAEAIELLRIWGIDPNGERAKKLLEEARATGELTAQKERAMKFNKGTETVKTEASSLMEQADALMQFGLSGKQTALQLAELKISQEGLNPLLAEGAIQARLQAAASKDVATAYRDLAKLGAEITEKNREVEAAAVADILNSEAEKVLAKRETMMKAIEFSTAQAEAARNLGIMTQNWGFEQEAAFQRMIDGRKSAIAALDEQTATGLQHAAIVDMNNLLQDSKTFAEDLGAAFGGVGAAIGNMNTALISSVQNQLILSDAMEHASKLRGKGEIVKASKVEQEAIKTHTKAQLKSYGDMAGAAKGFFKENSKGYNTMHAAEQAFRTFEMAIALESFVTKSGLMDAFLGLFIASKTTEVAVEAATVAPTVAAEGAKASAFGLTAVIRAISSMPFPMNLVAGAVTLAAVVALGASLSGGGVGSSSVSKDRQAANGTGTVFGNEGAKSESIGKSIELLANNSNIALEYTSGMLSSLKNIEANISGLATMVVQASGLRGTRADVKALNLKAPSNFLSSLFGGKTQTLLDSGISVAAQKIGDALNGIAAQTYAEIQTTRKVLGITVSNKKETRYGELDSGLKDQFTRVLGDIVNGVVNIAEQFGQKGSTVRDVINALDIDLKEISFKDLTGEEIQKELEALFSSIGDKISAAALATLGLEEFQKTGEGFMQTAIRVSTGVESAKFELDKLGIQAIDYTKITQKQGDVAAEIFRDSVLQTQKLGEGLTGVGQIMSTMTGTVSDLAGTFAQLLAVQQSMTMVGMNSGALGRSMIYGAGDLASLQSGFDTYFENFFDVNEQLQAKTGQLKLKFEALGVAMPDSKEGFRALINSIPTATAEGQKLVGQLLLLADGFNDVSQMARDAKNDALDKAFAALERSVDAEKKRLTEAYDSEVKRLKKKAEDDIAAAKLSLKPAEEALKSIQSIFDAIKSAIKSTVIESAALSAARRKEAQSLLGGALGFSNTGGSLVGYGGFEEALQTISKPSESLFASFEDYARDQAITAQILEGLSTNAKKQVSTAQLTIDAINATMEAIKSTSEKELEALEARHNAQLDRLDLVVEMAQREIDAINGVDNSIKSLAIAISKFNVASVAAGGTGTVTNPTSGSSTANSFVESLYTSILGRPSEAAGLAHWSNILDSGSMTVQEVIAGFYGSDEYKSMHPSFDVGTNSVPYDMTANIHEGERIIPKADNVELMRRLSEPNGSKEEREALAAAIVDLKQTIISGDVANVQQARELLKLIRKWDGEGMPEERDVTE